MVEFPQSEPIQILGTFFIDGTAIPNVGVSLLLNDSIVAQALTSSEGTVLFDLGQLALGTYTAQLLFSGLPGRIAPASSDPYQFIIYEDKPPLNYMYPDPANVLYYEVNIPQNIPCPPFISNGTLFTGTTQLQLMRMDTLQWWNGTTWVGSAVWLAGTQAGTGIYFYRFTPPIATTYFVMWNAAGSLFTERTFVASDPIVLRNDANAQFGTMLGSMNAMLQRIWDVVMGTHHPQIQSYIDTATQRLAGTGVYTVTVEVKTTAGSKVPGVLVAAINQAGYWAGMAETNSLGTCYLYLQPGTYTFVSIQNGITRDAKQQDITGPTFISLTGYLDPNAPAGTANLPLALLIGTFYLPTGEPAEGTINISLYCPSKPTNTYLCETEAGFLIIPGINITSTTSSTGYASFWLIPNNLLSPADTEYRIIFTATVGKQKVQILDASFRFIGTAGGTYFLKDFIS